MKKSAWRYHHFTYVYPKLWSDDVWFLRYGAWQMLLLFLILGYFLPFYPSNSPKNQNFEKTKTTPGDIIILHMFPKNYDQMMYCYWDMVRDRRTDARTDGRKKWHKEVGAPPKNE